MKCTISKTRLQNMLAKVQGFTERKSTLPILSHVLLETEENTMQIKATDLHTSIQVKAECSVEVPGACAINAKGFYDVIRELPEEDLLIWTEGYTRAHVTEGNRHIKMNIMDPEEYPSIEFSSIDKGCPIPVDTMKPLIERTIFSIPPLSETDSKYTLNGALLVSREEKPKGSFIEMVTTDSRRLSLARYPISGNLDMGDGIIVPRKGLQELKRLIDGKDEGAKMMLSKDSLFFVSKDTTATVRLIDGKFPDYRSVVSTEGYPFITRFTAQELIEALKLCGAMVSEIANCVKFSFTKDKTIIYAHNPEQGEVETSIAAEHQGEDIEITFNPRYFMECLVFVEGEAEVRLKGPQGPCMVTDGGKTECKWVIMPMRF